MTSKGKLPHTTAGARKKEVLNAKASQQTYSPGSKTIEGSIPPSYNALSSLGLVEVLPTACFPVPSEIVLYKYNTLRDLPCTSPMARSPYCVDTYEFPTTEHFRQNTAPSIIWHIAVS